MPIIVNLDIMMARRKISLSELAERIDLTPANLSILKTGKAKAVRFSTHHEGKRGNREMADGRGQVCGYGCANQYIFRGILLPMGCLSIGGIGRNHFPRDGLVVY